MLDSFLKVACSRAKAEEDQIKLTSAMRHLPADYLYKLAMGQEKLAYISGPCDPDWLDKFKGTPLFERAIELEKQELQQQMAEQTRYREEEQVRTERSAARDEIQVQRKLLELELAEVEAGGSLSEEGEEAPPEELGAVPEEGAEEAPADAVVPTPPAPTEAIPEEVPAEEPEVVEVPEEVVEGAPPPPPKPKEPSKEEKKTAAAFSKAVSKLKGGVKRTGELFTGSRAKRLENVAKKTSNKAGYHKDIAARLMGHGPTKAVVHHAALAGKNQARFSHFARGAGEEHAKVRATRAVAGSAAVGALGGAAYAQGRKAGRKEKSAHILVKQAEDESESGRSGLRSFGGALVGAGLGGLVGSKLGRAAGRFSTGEAAQALLPAAGLGVGALGGGILGAKYASVGSTGGTASVMFKEAIDIMGLGRAIGAGAKSIAQPAMAAGKPVYQAARGLGGAGQLSAMGQAAAPAAKAALQAVPRAAQTVGRAGMSFAKAHPYQAAGLAGGTALAGGLGVHSMMSD